MIQLTSKTFELTDITYKSRAGVTRDLRPFSPVGIPVLGLPSGRRAFFLLGYRGYALTSIRQKLLLSTTLVLVVFCAGVLILSRTVMLDGYLDLEMQDMQQHLNRVNKAVASYFDVLDTTAFDWAAWDDTYAFVENKNPEFVKTNLVDETFNENGLRLNFMVFLDAKHNIVFQKGYDWEKKKQNPFHRAFGGI